MSGRFRCLRRHRGALAALILPAAVLGAALLAPGCAARPPVLRREAPALPAAWAAPRGGIRVLTYNMLHGWPRFRRLAERSELLAAALRELQADVVVLREVPVLSWGARHLGVWLAGRLGCG